MDHLSKDQIETLRERLAAERTTLIARQEDVIDAADEGLVEVGDAQDRASEELLRAGALRFAARDRARLVAIQHALDRMRDGSYGLCEESDDPIPYARLEIDPTTRYSVEVQEMLEALSDDEGQSSGPY